MNNQGRWAFYKLCPFGPMNERRPVPMKTLLPAALLALSLSTSPLVLADAPTTPAPADTTTAAPAGSFAAPTAPLVPGSAAAALDALAGKPQIVGITLKNGTLLLGRVISGDHTNYAVQAFHFVGRTRTVSQTVGTGRYRRTMRTQQPTTLPDVQAVGYLLRGAAGSKTNPPEVLAGSGTLAASDIKFLQALSPPTKAARKAARKAVTPPAPATSTPATSTAAATPAAGWAWTMTTLWPPAKGKK